jgi:hypothetical protein
MVESHDLTVRFAGRFARRLRRPPAMTTIKQQDLIQSVADALQ